MMNNSENMAEQQQDEDTGIDICRVCRTEGSADRPLFYPCLCIGSIKYIHQECLMQWLKYSKKEFCELCNYKYTFQPIYHPDMPKRLPMGDLFAGFCRNIWKAIRCWFIYTIVAVAWLGIVPLTASRIYRTIFAGSVTSLLTLPLEMLSTDHLLSDCLQGCFIISVFLCTFICLVWLREQIIHGGPPQWLNLDPPRLNNNEGAAVVEQVPLPVNEEAEIGQNEAQPVDGVGVQNEIPQQQQQEENNWLDWDRPGEDLSWERLLGLDGSLVFLEHIFWVISLNTFFTLVFAFSPYHVGHVLAVALRVKSYFRDSRFDGVLTALFGYLIICAAVFCLHKAAKFFRFKLAHRATGMSYLVLKVFLLVLVEVGIFPLLCGWWLDACSLSLFAATLNNRLQGFSSSPGTSMFVHWLVGMVYVFYFASFVLILREVLRPGVLWFLRNLNDPEFNPVQEMIQLPVLRHVRRLFASTSLFSIAIFLVIYCPIRILHNITPALLPYNISLTAETPLSELSLELLLLQVILPALLEQSHARVALKTLVRWWCLIVGKALNLTDYLLPADPNNATNDVVLEPVGQQNGVQDGVVVDPAAQGNNLAAEHQALLLAREPSGFQPYRRPPVFALRICLLLICLAASSVVFSVVCFSVPVTIGRWAIFMLTGQHHVHELYTVSSGLYLSWVILKSLTVIAKWVTRGWRSVADGVKYWTVVLGKCVIAGLAVVGWIPLLLGICFQLVVLTPVRVNPYQTPLFFLWQDWAMGILHCKIVCAGIMMGPDWWMKQVFERLYQDGIRSLDLFHLYRYLVIPVSTWVGMVIAIPYIVAHTLIPALGASTEEEMIFQRYSYPCILFLSTVTIFVVWQFQQLSTLLLRIRNEKYLVGHRLVNYGTLSFAAENSAQPTQETAGVPN